MTIDSININFFDNNKELTSKFRPYKIIHLASFKKSTHAFIFILS